MSALMAYLVLNITLLAGMGQDRAPMQLPEYLPPTLPSIVPMPDSPIVSPPQPSVPRELPKFPPIVISDKEPPIRIPDPAQLPSSVSPSVPAPQGQTKPQNPPSTNTKPQSPPTANPPVPAPTAASSKVPPKSPAQDKEDHHVGPPDDFWGAIGYLGYQFRSAPLGAATLIQTNAAGTQSIAVSSKADFGWASGLTLSGGVWLDERHIFGLELGGFLTGQVATSESAVGGPNQTLSRPFLNALTSQQSQFFVAAPGQLSGSFHSDSTAQLGGFNLTGVRNLVHEKDFTINFLVGFRYFDLDESLRLMQSTTPIGSAIVVLNGVNYPAGTPLTIADRFATRNQFYGSEFGMTGEWRYGPACFSISPRIGFGTNHETVSISGESQVPGVTIPGGFLALPGGNGGRETFNRFSLFTEVRAEVGVYLTSRSRLSLGYDLLYLNNVARPGGQIDSVINPRLVPTSRDYGSLSGVTSPLPISGVTDFLANGIRVTLEVRY